MPPTARCIRLNIANKNKSMPLSSALYGLWVGKGLLWDWSELPPPPPHTHTYNPPRSPTAHHDSAEVHSGEAVHDQEQSGVRQAAEAGQDA